MNFLRSGTAKCGAPLFPMGYRLHSEFLRCISKTSGPGNQWISGSDIEILAWHAVMTRDADTPSTALSSRVRHMLRCRAVQHSVSDDHRRLGLTPRSRIHYCRCMDDILVLSLYGSAVRKEISNQNRSNRYFPRRGNGRPKIKGSE